MFGMGATKRETVEDYYDEKEHGSQIECPREHENKSCEFLAYI